MIEKGYSKKQDKVDRCIDLANELLKKQSFYTKITNKKTPFDMATASPAYIARKLKSERNHTVCTVRLYSKRFSKALAFFDARYPGSIFINEAKLGRSDGSVVATIIHEWVHLVDNNDPEESFGHGSNSSKGKQNTAPYWIDNLAQSMIDGEKDFNNNESSKIVTRRSWWSRFKDWVVFWR